MPLNLIPQDQGTLDDQRGRRKPIRPDELRSGTLFGQYQLRGSILTIKDASTTASGFMSFSDSMVNAPTSSASGTGLYLDYTGIYGLVAGVKQFYWTSADGKGYAGAGAVTLDTNGVTITETSTSSPYLTFKDDSANTLLQVHSQLATPTLYILNDVNATGAYTTIDYRLRLYGASSSLLSMFQHTHTGSFVAFGYGSTPPSNTLAIVSEDTDTSDVWDWVTQLLPASNTATFRARSAGVSERVVATVDLANGRFRFGDTTAPVGQTVEIGGTAPSFSMRDTTASAKSLLVTVDANKAVFEEAGGTDVMVLDLANARVGIANAAPAVALDVTGEIRASSVLRTSGVTAGKIQMNVVSNLANNGVAQVSVSAADIEIIMLLQSDGSSAIFALKGGANATALVGTGGTYSVTAGTAGTNVYWSAGNSRYEIENKTGGARTYEVFSFNAA